MQPHEPDKKVSPGEDPWRDFISRIKEILELEEDKSECFKLTLGIFLLLHPTYFGHPLPRLGFPMNTVVKLCILSDVIPR